jgi:uncharacterized membrane protein YecN with MAPEG domain
MEVTTSARAAAFWIGLLLLLMLVLSVLVVRQRNKHKVMLGDDGVAELQRASRVFGNATEYIPAAMAALAALALVQAPMLVVNVTGLLLFVGRVGHAVGLSNSGGESIGRSLGMVSTWLAFIFGGVALLFYAFG